MIKVFILLVDNDNNNGVEADHYILLLSSSLVTNFELTAGSDIVNDIMKKAKEKNIPIHFPVDFVTADKFDKNAETATATKESGIPEGWMGLDCGPQTIANFTEVINRAKTILWNG